MNPKLFDEDDLQEDIEQETNKNISAKKIYNTNSLIQKLKLKLPKKRLTGVELERELEKIRVKREDFAYLIGYSAGSINNMLASGNDRCKGRKKIDKFTGEKKPKERKNILIEIAVAYLKKLVEEEEIKVKEEKKEEKERVLNVVGTQVAVATTLSLRDCNTMENRVKIIDTIYNLQKAGENKISYQTLSKQCGLTPHQIALIREQDQEIDNFFNVNNEVEFNRIQDDLTDIIDNNKDNAPNVSLKAIETKLKYLKSNQKDKDEPQKQQVSVWDMFKNENNMKDITSSSEIIVIEQE